MDKRAEKKKSLSILFGLFARLAIQETGNIQPGRFPVPAIHPEQIIASGTVRFVIDPEKVHDMSAPLLQERMSFFLISDIFHLKALSPHGVLYKTGSRTGDPR